MRPEAVAQLICRWPRPMPSSLATAHNCCSQVAGARRLQGCPEQFGKSRVDEHGLGTDQQAQPHGRRVEDPLFEFIDGRAHLGGGASRRGEVSVDKEEVVVMQSFRCLRLLVAVAGTRAPAVCMLHYVTVLLNCKHIYQINGYLIKCINWVDIKKHRLCPARSTADLR